MGELNKIYNSLKVISEGSSVGTTGFTVCHSGDTTSAAGTTSFIVRDGGHVGINTSAPVNGWGGAFGGFPHHPNLHVDGYVRITETPNVKGLYLAVDSKGNVGRTSGPGVPLTGDTYAVSAYTSGCTLFITTNAGTVLTADTCSQFDSSPYEYKLALGSIGPKLPVWGSAAENYINANSPYSNIQGGYKNRIEMQGVGYHGILSGYHNRIGITNAGNEDYGGYHVLGGGYENNIDGNDTWYNALVGGESNGISGTTYSFLGGGYRNKLLSAGSSVLAGGQLNRLESAQQSGILGGIRNVIETGGAMGGILNGSANTITHNFSAAIGTEGRFSSKSHYTYLQGLDADTDSKDGPKPFRYHGNFAQQGINKVLTDIDGSGNAVWMPTRGVRLTGDCVAISAYTTGCTLFVLTGPPCNQILTADTCSSISGPYEYGGAAQAIQPILGANTSDGVASAIQGGIANIIGPGTAFVGVGTGNNNLVNHATNSHITSGSGNKIGIDSVCPPGVNCLNTLSNIVGGNSSIISAASRSTIVGGYINQVIDIDYATILGGANNWINSNNKGNDSYSLIGQGVYNLIQQTSTTKPQYATILNGKTNVIRPLSNYATINGGLDNTISASSFSQILMGWDNIIQQNYEATKPGQNTILNGENSVIRGGNFQHILGGLTNRIYDSIFSHIVGGSGNTIGTQVVGSAIIGGLGITATRPQTTYTKGLDTDTNTTSGPQYFKYHGNLAQPGLNRVLTDIDGTGNAVWTDLPLTPGFTGGTGTGGDEFVVSATTSGCTTYFFTNSGNTFTADTCNSFTPYRYGQAPNSIRPVFPNGPVAQNRIDPTSTESVISGGRMNRISGSTLSNIHGGRNNRIDMRGTGSFWNSIFGGANNLIHNRPASVGPFFQNAIVHGDQNVISGGARNMIVQGFKNRLTGTYASIVNGAHNYMGHRSSVIMGGEHIHSWTSHTVHTRGLYVNTDIQEDSAGPTNLNQRPFRYNGAFAVPPGENPTGYYLRSWNENGDAYWDRGATVPMGPDHYALSAYTSGCTLYVTVSNGTTLTADTCNGDFSNSPYEYGGGVDVIQPVLPGFPTAGFHEILPLTSYDSIQGGYDNRIANSAKGSGANGVLGSCFSLILATVSAGTHAYANVVAAGSSITISGCETTLVSGQINTVADTEAGLILGANQSHMKQQTTSSIIGGQFNDIFGVPLKGGSYPTGNFIGGGSNNSILSATTHSSILGGSYNDISIYGTSNFIGASTFGTISRNQFGEGSSSSSILGSYTSALYGTTSSSVINSFGIRSGYADASNENIWSEKADFSAVIGLNGPSTSFGGHNNPNMMSGTTLVNRLKVTGGMYENTTVIDSLESGINYRMTPNDHHIYFIKDDASTSFIYLPTEYRGGLRIGRKITVRIIQTPTGTGEVRVMVGNNTWEGIVGCPAELEGIGTMSTWTGISDVYVMGGETGMCSADFIAVPTEQLPELTYPVGIANQQPLPNGGTQKYLWFYTAHEQFK